MPQRFKTYICQAHPNLIIGTAIKEAGGHKLIRFGVTLPGLFTASSKEEEEIVEASSSYKVTVFPFDQGKQAEEIRERDEEAEPDAPAVKQPKTKAGFQRKG